MDFLEDLLSLRLPQGLWVGEGLPTRLSPDLQVFHLFVEHLDLGLSLSILF